MIAGMLQSISFKLWKLVIDYIPLIDPRCGIIGEFYCAQAIFTYRQGILNFDFLPAKGAVYF